MYRGGEAPVKERARERERELDGKADERTERKDRGRGLEQTRERRMRETMESIK
jgi:hypothetical protein